MEYPYFKGLEADRYSFYRVPKALVKADLFQKMSGDAKLLYLPQKTGRNERTGDCRAAEQRERAGSQRVQTAVWSELSQWVQSWHSCKVAGDSGASDSEK